MEKSAEARVFAILSTIMDVPAEQINRKSSPDTIASWDSLSHMKLVIALEEEFQVEFSDDQIVDMISVELILATLKESGIRI
jgi:acyl carrier protein